MHDAAPALMTMGFCGIPGFPDSDFRGTVRQTNSWEAPYYSGMYIAICSSGRAKVYRL